MIVVIDSVSGKVVSGPEIHARGFAEDDAASTRSSSRSSTPSTRRSREGVNDTYQLQQTIRRVVGRWVNGELTVAGR